MSGGKEAQAVLMDNPWPDTRPTPVQELKTSQHQNTPAVYERDFLILTPPQL